MITRHERRFSGPPKRPFRRMIMDPASQPQPVLAAGARFAPPDAGHVAAVRRRRGCSAGRPAYPGRDGTPRPQAPYCPLPLPLFFSARERSRSSSNHRGAVAGQRSAARRRPR
jgi:hypothetical protein